MILTFKDVRFDARARMSPLPASTGSAEREEGEAAAAAQKLHTTDRTAYEQQEYKEEVQSVYDNKSLQDSAYAQKYSDMLKRLTENSNISKCLMKCAKG